MKYIYLLTGIFLLVQHGDNKHEGEQSKVNINQLKRFLMVLQITLQEYEDQSLTTWLEEANEMLRKNSERSAYLEYQYETNINEENAKKLSDAEVEMSKITKKIVKKAREYLRENPDVGANSTRQLERMSIDGTPKDPKLVRKLQEIQSKLESIYGKAVISKDGKNYRMEPEIGKLMAKSRDPNELQWAWQSWRDVTGKQMRTLYEELVRISNVGATDNGYSDTSQLWLLSQFGSTDGLQEEFEKLWAELKPMYHILHAYVRNKLKSYYAENHPDYKFPDDGTIPAHLLGNMWAQQWDNIYDMVKPYPSATEIKPGKNLKMKYPTALDLFRLAEEFYTSIGLFPMTSKFWNGSMIERPTDREVQCHASAFDFHNEDDFRIKMCTEVNMGYLETIHHEMGHIEYFMAYRHQPEVYRDGANCGFHEAIGDTIALSVGTQKHLKKIGLLAESQQSVQQRKESDLNYLMQKALLKIAFLPFGYMIDKWRWDVFSGKIKPEEYNKAWWDMRKQYQGISPPLNRSEEDFDPGAKFHIPANSPYICYFVSFILQFQFYEALCKESGHIGPLYACDFYQSTQAGAKFRQMLELGASQPWPDTLEMFTGSRKISATSIKKYFEPLTEWLKSQVDVNNIGLGENLFV